MKFVLFFLIAFVGIPLNAFVLQKLWFWFIIPFGMPHISLGHAVGLSVIAAILSHQLRKPPEDSKEVLGEFIASMLFLPPIQLLIGFLAHLLM